MSNTYVKINFKEIKEDKDLNNFLSIKDYIMNNKSIIDNFEIIYDLNNISEKIIDSTDSLEISDKCINDDQLNTDDLLGTSIQEDNDYKNLKSDIDNDLNKNTDKLAEIMNSMESDIDKILSKYCMEYSWMPVSNEKYPVFRGDGFKTNLLCDYNRLCKISKEVIDSIFKYIPKLSTIGLQPLVYYIISSLENLKYRNIINPTNLNEILDVVNVYYQSNLNYLVKCEKDGLYKIIRYPSASYKKVDILINELNVINYPSKKYAKLNLSNDELIRVRDFSYKRFDNLIFDIYHNLKSIIKSEKIEKSDVVDIKKFKSSDLPKDKVATIRNNITIVNEYLENLGFPYKLSASMGLIGTNSGLIIHKISVDNSLLNDKDISLSSCITNQPVDGLEIKAEDLKGLSIKFDGIVPDSSIKKNDQPAENSDFKDKIKNKIIGELSIYNEHGLFDYYTMKKIIEKLFKLISKYDNSNIMLNPDGDIDKNIDFINKWLSKRKINYAIINYYPFQHIPMNILTAYKIIQTKD